MKKPEPLYAWAIAPKIGDELVLDLDMLFYYRDSAEEHMENHEIVGRIYPVKIEVCRLTPNHRD